MLSLHFRSAGFLVFGILSASNCRDVATTRDAGAEEPQQTVESLVALPNKPGSFKFAVLGDFGIASREQYQLADQMAKLHDRFKYQIVVMVGDNLYGSERPQDFQKKFEIPYKLLLDSGVKFYGALGNHDAREQRFYKLFNMDGKLYYTMKPVPDVRMIFTDNETAFFPLPDRRSAACVRGPAVRSISDQHSRLRHQSGHAGSA